jgi:putrescine importer
MEISQPDLMSHASSDRKLRRVLKLSDLILYGIILIMPIAAVPLFGLAQKQSNGHAITAILLAMVAMTLTAFSYGRMAALYPVAGSAYSYVGHALNQHLGFLAGWAMMLDYLLVPLLCVIYGSLTLQRLIPAPYWLWAAIFAIVITGVNLKGIRTASSVNLVLMIVMCVVVVIFMGLAVRLAAAGWQGLFSLRPFYNPATFSIGAVATGTSLAALSYGGFDGISTLAEEVENPRRNVLLATVLVCVFTGVFSGLQIYLAQMVRPDFHTFPNLETAFIDVARDVGGPLLYQGMAIILIVANLGSGLTAQAGIARLLFGMGRDQVLPGRVFGYLSPKTGTPTFNILLVGLGAFGGALVFDYERAAELINFGAFLAFMGVNAAAIRHAFCIRRSRPMSRFWLEMLPAIGGFLFCLAIWLSLPRPAIIAGGIWVGVGIIYHAVSTHGFRDSPLVHNLSPD